MQNNKNAFTLAEVLIVLAIIGVVAAITIPSVIAKYNRLQVETGLVVAYNNIKQIINAAEMDEGPMTSWELLTRKAANEDDFVEKFTKRYFAPYVQGAKYGVSTLADFGYEDGIKYPTDKSYAMTNTEERTMMMLPNGMMLIFASGKHRWGFEDSSKPDGYDYVDTPSGGLLIHADINGPKKPNVVGKDVFSFEIYLEKINTLSMAGHLNIWAKDGTESVEALRESFRNGDYGWNVRKQDDLENMCNKFSPIFCGALIMRNGWKIPKDYPWL